MMLNKNYFWLLKFYLFIYKINNIQNSTDNIKHYESMNLYVFCLSLYIDIFFGQKKTNLNNEIRSYILHYYRIFKYIASNKHYK